MQKIQSVISSKYQTVIPSKIRRRLNLKAGDTLVWQIVKHGRSEKALTSSFPKKWSLYTKGLGRDIWQDIDIDTYISSLRKEWQEQK